MFISGRRITGLGASLLKSKSTFHRSIFRPMQVSQASLSTDNTALSSTVRRLLKNAEVFCFDVDSTVITSEGIDCLAAHKGVGEQVAQLTKTSMDGDMPFEVALAERLKLIRPSQADFEGLHTENPPVLSPYVKELISSLQSKGIVVYLLSGGFRQMIEPIADMVQVPHHRIYANNVLFNKEDGSYLGYDDKEFTSRSGGKSAAVQELVALHGYSNVVMVGDGATDMEARPPADVFIGYGGNIVRDKVKDGADWFVTDFKDVLDLVNSSD